MSKKTIIGAAIPNIPWEDRPKNCMDPIWRYSQNPIIKRDSIPCSNSIFNSAVVPFKGKFAGVFRCDDKRREMRIHAGFSEDGLKWEINHEPIKFIKENDEIGEFEYAYDPRVTFIKDRYYVTWCNGYHGPTIGLAYTFDFKEFHQIDNITLPYNRNGVLFPKKINGNYAMLSRPSDTGHTAFGDIFYSESPDLTFWGKHKHVMGTKGWWQSTKIGAGPVPIETKEGWLLFYHGVLNSCNGYVYHFGAAILDLEKPWKVLYRTEPYLMSPQTQYECLGDVPNVVFPCAALADSETGKIAVYYGAADTVTGIAYTQVDELIEYIKNNSKV